MQQSKNVECKKINDTTLIIDPVNDSIEDILYNIALIVDNLRTRNINYYDILNKAKSKTLVRLVKFHKARHDFGIKLDGLANDIYLLRMFINEDNFINMVSYVENLKTYKKLKEKTTWRKRMEYQRTQTKH